MDFLSAGTKKSGCFREVAVMMMIHFIFTLTGLPSPAEIEEDGGASTLLQVV